MLYSQIMMLTSGVSSSMDFTIPMSERLVIGIQTLGLGMGIVMFVLALLWGVLELFKFVFYNDNRHKESVPVQPENHETAANDDEIITAITAAITAYRAASSAGEYTGGFRVVSFKKTNAAKTTPAVRKN